MATVPADWAAATMMWRVLGPKEEIHPMYSGSLNTCEKHAESYHSNLLKLLGPI